MSCVGTGRGNPARFPGLARALLSALKKAGAPEGVGAPAEPVSPQPYLLGKAAGACPAWSGPPRCAPGLQTGTPAPAVGL